VAVLQFSIVITCRNQRSHISDAVDSALGQIFSNREIIVVDDASTDGSDAVLRCYADKIRLIRLERNQGAPSARNAGAAAARGKYLVYLDGDDALKSWALWVYDKIIQARNPVLLLASLSWFKDSVPESGHADIPQAAEFVSYNNWIEKDRPFRSSASALVIERSAFESIGGWSKDVWPFDDQYLAAELAYSGRTIQILKPATVFYRRHAGNTIDNIPLLVRGCYRFVAAWESNKRFYGAGRNLERFALIGGPALWVVKKTLRAGQRLEALRLLLSIWPRVIAAAFLRLRAVFWGQVPKEIFPLRTPLNTVGRDSLRIQAAGSSLELFR
jgi:glycosyltransferase involved in cell wall biosynthesis